MTGKEKIEALLKHLGKNPTELSKSLGMSRAQGIYDILDNTIDVSKKMASKIKTTYPEINTAWLLTGEGEMLEKKLNQANEHSFKYLVNANPFKNKEGPEWAVIELLVQELAIDRSRQMKRPLPDCLEELYAKIDSIINGDKNA